MLIKKLALGLINEISSHWKVPPMGKYVPYKGIFGYSVGGIGAYMIITMGTACLLSANNTLLTMTLGVNPTHVYIMYAIAVIINIPLTGIRANIIDNTRNKAGKYRPYILTMAVPAAVLCLVMVWFPYGALENIPALQGEFLGQSLYYVVKCAIILALNIALHFFYYFFYDSYENLIHVLSPDTQERANIASVKSIVYSFAPTLVNLISPLIAEHIFKTNMTDIRVFRLLYPILTVGGLLLCILVYKNTEEKIVQARTHVVQIKFRDALRAVAKNKYFWIISLAGWVGFLEASYANILSWLYNYGGACNGDEYALITTVYGNASLWGMILAPFAIKKWGKKAVLIVTNIFNIVFILLMLPCCQDITKATIWLVMGCLWFNALMGSFAHILNPSIQADIRDYQQYKTGERIDGMFSAVGTIGTVITLLTAGVLPFIYERNGLTKDNALKITHDPEITSRVLGNGKTIAQILEEQLAEGQNNYENATSALYDTNILLSLLQVLILLAAFGALMNVIPYIWYDFNEKKQKSVVSVLKVRAMFEDYGNNISNDLSLVEGIEIIREARAMANEAPLSASKKDYASKKEFKKAREHNNKIDIAKFVCDELDRFSSPFGQYQLSEARKIYAGGLNSILHYDIAEINEEIRNARSMPKATAEEKELRKYALETAKNKKFALKAAKKYYAGKNSLKAPSFGTLENYYEKEEKLDMQLKSLYAEQKLLKKSGKKAEAKKLLNKINDVKSKKAKIAKNIKAETERHARFNRATKPYIDAEKLLNQAENYSHFEDIVAMYDDAKARYEKHLEERKAEEQKNKQTKLFAKAK